MLVWGGTNIRKAYIKLDFLYVKHLKSALTDGSDVSDLNMGFRLC